MSEQVYVYALNRKFVDEKDVPEEARQVMYYSLAIGHHLGVVDCFKVILSCSLDEYRSWIEMLPEASEARRKMEGYFTFGEITIYPEHIHMLAHAFNNLKLNQPLNEKVSRMCDQLLSALHDIFNEPTMYLMVRSR
ncbi:formate hydrogenlyase maturation HycH family protein [Ferrimonas balearica]|uniref:formate hydrogenlyase maturation HycH family protein n=1 Tax=Ferrimonas balearica TaxID=44012 RepID=UPI001C9426EB|nr:formate hydrogenlyase maturation HycH family protein [Ferrimonas balearica]MBY5979437.1 formate hydrogenlyase maturation HycH family protein [Ferrimonas balearica]